MNGSLLSVNPCQKQIPFTESTSCHQIYVTMISYIYIYDILKMGRHSESLRAGKSWDRIPVVATFSTSVQTGPGVKWPVCGVDHLTPM